MNIKNSNDGNNGNNDGDKHDNKNSILKLLYKPYVGIPLILAGLILLLSPLITSAMTRYHQNKLLSEYEEAMNIDLPDFDDVMDNGVPTRYENVIIKIPKLNVEAAIIPPPEDYDLNIYESLLKRGPVFFTQSFPPGAVGNVAITGHRIDYGDHFKDLDFLEKGDEIILETPGFKLIYEFVESVIVDEYDWSKITDHSEVRRLVLHTCDPKTTRQHTPHRLIVRAELKNMDTLIAESEEE